MDFDNLDTGIRRALNVIGVAAVVAVPLAIFAGGWFVLAALGVAAASMGINAAMDATKWECDTEAALCEACSQPDAAPASEQPAQAAGKQWAAAVAASKHARRSR